MSHFRTREQDEVDLVLENRRGRIVGIEVKAAVTLRPKDFSGLKKLQEAAGDKFIQGFVRQDHDRATPFSETTRAVAEWKFLHEKPLFLPQGELPSYENITRTYEPRRSQDIEGVAYGPDRTRGHAQGPAGRPAPHGSARHAGVHSNDPARQQDD
ncbi:DUF4143 domain-containing protein [Bosea sp. Tri-49]|uniref:DUF4143 domain-containing protein n=1 Tax=Bosea sp. Tri-49 TaxID=1867715 RepID=UPI001F309547|nr:MULTISPECIES: DUF4143 domain-containing protein [unclassified Bosea (in: a-proteobacteria)]